MTDNAQRTNDGPERNAEDVALIGRLADDLKRAYEVINRHGLMDEVFPPGESVLPPIEPIEGLEFVRITDLMDPEKRAKYQEQLRQMSHARKMSLPGDQLP